MSACAARGRGGGEEGGGVARAVHLPVVPGEQGLRRLQPTTTTSYNISNNDNNNNTLFKKGMFTISPLFLCYCT
jgi:hypothetical protein